MKSSIIISIFIVFIVPFLAFSSDESGGVKDIFSYGAGLRALGMGSAFTAMDNDATLTYWNPGAMAFNQYKELSLFGTRTIADSYYVAGFYSNPTINVGTMSLGFLGVYTSGIESYDSKGIPITTHHNNYLHYQILLAYGYNFSWGLGLGAVAKVEQMRVLDNSGTGAGFDVGAYYRPRRLQWVSFGAVVQNVYGTGIKLGSEYEKSTRVYKAGMGTHFKMGKNKKSRLSVTFDSEFYTDSYNPNPGPLLYDFSLGTELSFSDIFMVRAGYSHFSPTSAFQNLPQGLSAGLSFRQWGFGIDYAVMFEDPEWQGTAELLMQLGISYRFGKSMEEKKAIEEQKIRQKIEEGIRNATKSYEEQLSKLKESYKREQQQIISRMEQEYQKKRAEIDQSFEQKREELIARLTAQYEAEKQRSLQELAKEYESQRAQLEAQLSQERLTYQQDVQNLQKKFEAEKTAITKKLQADEIFKSEHYARGLQLLSDGNYKDALTEFQTVARFDPNYLKVQQYIQRTKAEMVDVTSYSPEILNLYYRGVDLFVQKKYEEAIREWQKILKIDPYNKLALRNIKEARDRIKKLKQLGRTK